MVIVEPGLAGLCGTGAADLQHAALLLRIGGHTIGVRPRCANSRPRDQSNLN